MNVTIFLTHQCNLRCRYCYNGEKYDRVMPDQVARKAVRLAFAGRASDPVVIQFFGGEPLLELPIVRAIVKYARRIADEHDVSTLRFAITTNGTLLDADTASWLEKEHFSLTLSFDGCRFSQDHNRRFRDGTSSYDATLRGLRVALDVLSFVECNAVITPDTVEHLPDALDELLSMDVHAMTFTPDFEAVWSDQRLEVLEQALKACGERLVACYREGRTVDIEPWDTKIRSHVNGGFPCDRRCPFGQGEIAVAPSGRLYPCDRLVRQDDHPELAIGHVDTGLDTVKVIALRTEIDRSDPDCVSCELRGRCMHWCGCVNVATSGHVGTPSPTVCRIEQLTIAAADRVAARLYAEGNEAFIRKFYG